MILVHFRRLKQDPSDLRGCAGKLKTAQFVRLREVVSMMTNKGSGEEAAEEPEEEVQKNRKLAKSGFEVAI